MTRYKFIFSNEMKNMYQTKILESINVIYPFFNIHLKKISMGIHYEKKNTKPYIHCDLQKKYYQPILVYIDTFQRYSSFSIHYQILINLD